MSRNLLDEFPHPYSLENGKQWVSMSQLAPLRYANLAICVSDEKDPGKLIPVGGIGINPVGGLNKKRVKLVGYWLGEPYWGQGIVSEALSLMVSYAFSQKCAEAINNGDPISRLEAAVFAYNEASARVLAKNGFILEARQRAAYYKDGKDVDALQYVLLREDFEANKK